jgi:hypothetical protein
MARRWHAVSRLSAAALGLLGGVFGSELLFGHLRAAEPNTAVLYSLEVRNEQGDLLASPMVVGQENQPVHLDLSQAEGPHSEPLAMSIDLDPRQDGEGLCLGYKLSIDDGFAHQGRVGVAYGEQKSVHLRGGGQSLRLSLVVARAHTSDFTRALRKRHPAAS